MQVHLKCVSLLQDWESQLKACSSELLTERTIRCVGGDDNMYYSETSLIRHSMGPENNVGLGDCWIMECLLPYLSMVTVPHIMVGLERMLDYRGVGLARFHCT